MRTIGVISSRRLPTTGRPFTPANQREPAVPAHVSWLSAVLRRRPDRGAARAVDRRATAPRREQPMPFC